MNDFGAGDGNTEIFVGFWGRIRLRPGIPRATIYGNVRVIGEKWTLSRSSR